MEHESPEADSAQQVQRAAEEVAKAQAEFEITIAQILNQVTGGQGPSEAWLEARRGTLLQPMEPAGTEATPGAESG
jgi:hypothetical protein